MLHEAAAAAEVEITHIWLPFNDETVDG